MNEKIINNLMWWIPIRKLRDNVREYLINNENDKSNNYKKINDIHYKIDNFYKNENEKLISYPHNWLEYVDNENFIDVFEKLITNLDYESEEIVYTFFRRMIRRHKYKDNSLLTLTYSEKEYKKELDKKELYVLDFDDYIYYNKFKLPKNIPSEYSIDNNFIGIQTHEYIFNKYLTNIFFDNKDIIDAGACCGDTSIFLSQFTNKYVHAFEPVESTYNILINTLSLNRKHHNNIIPIKKALSNFNGNSSIFLSNWLPGASMSNTFKLDNLKEEKIEIIKLDDYVNENNLNVGLIKVDIEGEEQKFLEGAYNTISSQRPYLLISIYHNPSDFFNIKPIIESYNLNYKFYILKAIPHSGHYDISLLCIPRN